MKKILTIVLILYINYVVNAQMLSKNKAYIIQALGDITHKLEKTTFGDDCITVDLVKGCTCVYVISKDGICRKEIIIANTSIQVVELIVDMNEKYFLKTTDTQFYEESYGLVESHRINNIFTFEYTEDPFIKKR